MRGVEYLRENAIPLRSTCVLTKDSLDHPDEIYSFFSENKFEVLCFNIEEQEGINQQPTINMVKERKHDVAKKYRKFMERIYDLWAGGQ
jgi:uncharacterized protein